METHTIWSSTCPKTAALLTGASAEAEAVVLDGDTIMIYSKRKGETGIGTEKGIEGMWITIAGDGLGAGIAMSGADDLK